MMANASARAPGSPVSPDAPKSAANSLVRDNIARRNRESAGEMAANAVQNTAFVGSTVSEKMAKNTVRKPRSTVAAWRV